MKFDNQTIQRIESTLESIRRKKVILKYRQEHGLGLKVIDKTQLLEVLRSREAQEKAQEINFTEDDLSFAAKNFWEYIVMAPERLAILGYRLDHFQDAVEITRQYGVRSLCFIQEGYMPPAAGVDFYFSPETREGVEAYFAPDGQMHFSDVEIDAAWPMRIKELLRITAMAHYSDIVVKSGAVVRATGEELELEDEDESETEGQAQKRTIRFRRSHWRNLPADQKPSLKQFALAIASGKYSQEEVAEKKQTGHITFIREYVNPDLDPEALEPRKLFAHTGGAVNFLNLYLKIASD